MKDNGTKMNSTAEGKSTTIMQSILASPSTTERSRTTSHSGKSLTVLYCLIQATLPTTAKMELES